MILPSLCLHQLALFCVPIFLMRWARLVLHNRSLYHFMCLVFRASSPSGLMGWIFRARARLVSRAQKVISFSVNGACLDLLAQSAPCFASCFFHVPRPPHLTWLKPIWFFVSEAYLIFCVLALFCMPFFLCTEPALFFFVSGACLVLRAPWIISVGMRQTLFVLRAQRSNLYSPTE